jgi:hypothetical protein
MTPVREWVKQGEKPASGFTGQWTKSLTLEEEAKKNFSKLNERPGNFIENKWPLWKTWGRSGNFAENKGLILQSRESC